MPPGRKYLLKTILGPSRVHFRPHPYQWLTKSGDREVLLQIELDDTRSCYNFPKRKK